MATFRFPLFALQFLLCIWAQLVFAVVAQAEDYEVATWDALVPVIKPFDDPFIDMNMSEKMNFRDIVRALEAQDSGTATQELIDLAAGARDRLEATGLDPDYLLEQRSVVMDRQREQATGVTLAFLDRQILIDGYILPLSWKGDLVVEFLLVPWVGACIHTPPPPPNQIIHVNFPHGLAVERQFQAVRLAGTLRHAPAEHTVFLIDGSDHIPASFSLEDASVAGTPGLIEASSGTNTPALLRAQIWVHGLFTSSMVAISSDETSRAVWLAVLLAFGYGALHTLGPGHGKAVVVSYFVGTGGSLRRGLVMGLRIAVFHVLSAILVVFLFDLAIRQATGQAPSDYRLIRLFSYALIVAIGAVMLWQAVRKMQSSAFEHGRHGHSHDQNDQDYGSCAICNSGATHTGGGWIAAAVGVVPCTGALIVMLFGLANDLVWPAILMVVAISMGMAVAMAALGLAALWVRDWAELRFVRDNRTSKRFTTITRLTGATCILVIGCGLFATALLHAPPERTEAGMFATHANQAKAPGG